MAAEITKITANGVIISPETESNAVIHSQLNLPITELISDYNVSVIYPTLGDINNRYNLTTAISVLNSKLDETLKLEGVKLSFINLENKPESYIFIDGDFSNSSNWVKIDSSAVESVNGKTGEVVLTAGDISDVYSKTEIDTVIAEVETKITEIEGEAGDITNELSTITQSINSVTSELESSVEDVEALTIKVTSNENNITDLQTSLLGKVDSSDVYTKSETDTALASKASTTITDGLDTRINVVETKLETVEEGAQVNVQPDWNATTGDGEILNKPVIPSITGLATEEYVDTEVATKQDLLVSGTNLKTINGDSILGEGDLFIDTGGSCDLFINSSDPLLRYDPVSGELESEFSITNDTANNKIIFSGKNLYEEIDTTDFVKDSFLKSVSYNPTTSILTMVFIDENSIEQTVNIDYAGLIDIYTEGDGVSIVDNVVSVKINPDSSSLLSTSPDGLSASGISSEIERITFGENVMNDWNNPKYFVGYEGSTLTKSVVSEFGIDNANRVISSGGTNELNLKAFQGIYTPKEGEIFSYSMLIKNNSTTNRIMVNSNSAGSKWIEPLESTRVKFDGVVGNGINSSQFQIRSESIEQNVDFTWANIRVEFSETCSENNNPSVGNSLMNSVIFSGTQAEYDALPNKQFITIALITV